MEGYYLAKNYPFESFGLQKFKTGMKQAKQSMVFARNGKWQQEGPGNIGGRANTIAVNPDNDQELFLGYSLGGIHKSIDGAASWVPVFDNEVTTSISDIAYDHSNTDIIYAGTGDLNITGYPLTGNGIYKSTDGGNSWKQSGLTGAGIISEVSVGKINPNIVYAASMGVPFQIGENRGLYKSLDAGETWEKVLFIDDITGVIDIEVSPLDDNLIYAAAWTRISSYSFNTVQGEETRIYKSSDGGSTWTMMTEGLPAGGLVRPGLAMYPDDPNIVYSMFSRYVNDDEDLSCTGGYYIEGIYKTVNGGDTWEALPLLEENGYDCSFVGGFSWYFGKIRVNPNNPDDIFVLGVDLLRTRDGVFWEDATPPWWQYIVHADKHDLLIDNDNIYLTTDGGAYTSNLDNTESWEDIEDIISTQFYRIGYNPHDPTNFYGGAQDNGTTAGNVNDVEWPRLWGGDGFTPQFNPEDSTEYYFETQNGRINRFFVDESGFEDRTVISNSIEDEGRPNWDMPYFLDAADPNTVYAGITKVHRSFGADKDFWIPISQLLVDTFQQTIASSHNISALGQSTVNPNLFYAGTSDGYLWKYESVGTDWKRVGLELPERYYSDVRPSPNNENIVYASITGYEDDDNTPYIYKSIDKGETWFQIAGDMPQIAINDILIPKNQDADEQTVIVATDAGVYFTNNAGVNWFRLGDNMPIFPVFDLVYNPELDLLAAGTHARGIWTIPMGNIISSLEDIENLEVAILPNITSRYISVSGTAASYNYKVYDATGSEVMSGKLISSEPLEVSKLQSGYHFILLENNGKSVTKKFVKI